ncbi:hypothetical protein HC031_25980 [Planosporangium thailandense]|uniref:Beta-lactamase class A catalytic domain-containing protein n=1 Tax=Planosporangium thailandense TaxID=765197 RepID=A0ABX0Y414_9ACTN|nr:hypothetical protein [Planosporangium thailandense]NJC73141.1 hypothetical protein [Planosporangium thailandense]
MNEQTGNTPQRTNRPPTTSGTVYRSQAAAAPVSPPTASGAPAARPRRGRGPGRFALAALLILSTTASILAAYHLTSSAANAAAKTPAGVGTSAAADAPSAAAPSPTATPGVRLTAGPVNVNVDGFFSWALMDRTTGAISGSANDATETSTTESMIKIWISSDYLRRQAAAGNAPSQQRLDELTTMIRDSDDQAAEDIYRLDGGDDVVDRMISMCGLTNTTMVDGWWSKTQITAADATRLGLCVADGRAAGPNWTAWILDQMRQVRGEGRFGIVDALPANVAGTTAIKNGWTLIYDEGQWHVACLAVQDKWILSVLARYDGSRGLAYGANVCADVTRQLMAGSS